MNLLHHLRIGCRVLAKSPGLVLIAGLSLGLGIGANTAIFSILHHSLYSLPGVEAPEELVNVYTRRETGSTHSTNSIADLADLRAQSRAFEELAGSSWALANVEIGGDPTMQIASLVSPGYFEMLGIRPQRGRLWSDDELVPNGPPAVLVTDRFWRSALGERKDIVGERLRVGTVDFTVTGVLPEGFHGILRGLEPELFFPTAVVEVVSPAGEIATEGRRGDQTLYEWRGYRFMTLTGRLAEGETAGSAQAELTNLMANLEAAHPESNHDLTLAAFPTLSVRVHPDLDSTFLPAATLVMVMVGLVLLVACANVANLLLARATGRRREIGVRLALGAPRRDLLAQLLTESGLLAMVGTAIGLLVAFFALRGVRLMRLDLPVSPVFEPRIEVPVLLFTAGIAALTGIACGLAPALQAVGTNLVGALKSEASSPGNPRTSATGIRRLLPTMGSGLVVSQVALSLILVVGASLLARSVLAARDVALGYDADSIGAITIDLAALELDRDATRAAFERLEQAATSVAGVEAAGVTTRMPLGLNMWRANFFIPGIREREDDPPLNLEISHANNNYFDAMELEALEGRLFRSSDRPDTPHVAVVTRAMAERFWPGESSLGKRFRTNHIDGDEVAIVGVVPDHKVITPGEPARPLVYFPWSQRGGNSFAIVNYRSRGDAAAVLGEVKRAIAKAEPGGFVADASTLGRMRDAILLPVRAGGAVFSGMALLALVLAGTGLAGLIAYRTASRRREIGLRMALGAARSRVASEVLRDSLRLVLAGSALGLLGVLILGQLLQTVLYVSPWDPISLVGGVLVLILVASLASLVPARRAASVDPLTALRQA